MAERLRRRLPPTRDLVPIGVLLALAAALRVVLSLVYRPAALNQFDSNLYVWQAEGSPFESVFQAPGYSIFLRVPHLISDQVAFTISVQHLVALFSALIAWHIVYRLSGSRWAGLVPAAFVCFEADALLVEHALMSETLFTALVLATLWTALGALGSARPSAWLAAAGVLLGSAIWVRYAALALIPVLLGWAVFVNWRRPLAIARGLAALALPVVVLTAAQVVGQGAYNGSYALGESGGWALYSRVAPFADCERFTPPPGTERLCERTPPSERLHPDWYGYDLASPAKRLYTGQPEGNSELGAWARRAILAQPLDYADEVLDDLALFFDEAEWTNRNESLIGPRSVSFRLRAPDEHCDDCAAPGLGIEESSVIGWTAPFYGAYYAPFTPEVRGGIELFQDYQGVFRLHGWLFAALVLVALLGLFAARGREGRGAWLVVLAALAILVLPVATTTYNVRYGLPSVPLFAIGATLGARALWELRRGPGAGQSDGADAPAGTSLPGEGRSRS